MKRAVSMLTLFAIIFCHTCYGGAVKAAAVTDYVEVQLNSKLELKGFSAIEMGTSSNKSVVKRNNKEAWLCDVTQGASSSYIYFNVNNAFLHEIDDGTEVEITVEYFDCDNGSFTITYDGKNGSETDAEIVYGGKSNEWKTHTFVLDDAYFGDRLNGFDFRIGLVSSRKTITSDSSVAFGRVKVKKRDKANPVFIDISTDEYGNIFNNSDEKKFKVNYKNLQEEAISVEAKYEVIDSHKNVLWSSQEKISFDSGEEKEKSIDVSVDTYGVFDFRITLTNDKVKSAKQRTFSVVNTYDDEEKNDMFYMCTHMDRLLYPQNDMNAQIMLKAGTRGMRAEMAWNVVEEGGLGNFRLTDKHREYLETIAKYGLRVINILGYNDLNYVSVEKNLPETEQNFKAYQQYIKYIIANMKQRGIHADYEIWNEPNWGAKNGTPELYTELCKWAYEVIKENSPESKVLVGSLTGIGRSADAYFAEMVKYGVGNYTDALALHPYTQITNAKEAETDRIIRDKYKKVYGDATGDYDVEIYNTEIGYSTTDALGIEEDPEYERCKDIIISYVTLTGGNANDVFAYYDLVRDGNVKTYREHCFGLVNNSNPENNVPNSATPAYVVVANLNHLLANATSDLMLNFDEKAYMYVFDSKKYNANIGVLWSSSGEKDCVVNLGTNTVECYDMYGNKRTVNGRNGIFTFRATNEPIYIVGEFKKPSVSDVTPFTDYNIEKKLKIVNGDILNVKVHKNFAENAGIEIKASDSFEVVSNEGFSGDTANVSIKVKKDDVASDIFTLNVVEGNNVLQSEVFEVEFSMPATVTLKTELPDENEINKWNAILTVKNNSSKQCLNGYVTFEKPTGWSNLKIPIGRVPANRTAVVKFALPELIKKGMLPIKYELSLTDGTKIINEENIDFTLAKYASVKPEIDGKLGEWDIYTAMYSNDPSQIKMIKDYGGTDDLSAKSFVMWDEEYLYFASEVTDNIFSNTETGDTIWKGDSVQIGIYGRENEFVAMGQAGTNYTEIGIAKTPEGVQMHRWRVQNENVGETGSIENFEGEVIREGNKTYYEFKIPWKEVLPSNISIENAEKLGFSMLVNDNDGSGRRGWIEYASGIGESKNTAMFTYIKLLQGGR